MPGVAVWILIVVVLIGVMAWVLHNSLVAKRTKVHEGLSGVYVQLQRRADLIPGLVEVANIAMSHEREALERVVELRREFLAIPRRDARRLGANAGLLGETLGRVFALSEAYPDLRASEAFLELQRQLEETEDQIAASRRIYNANVGDFNTGARSFPGNLVARAFGFAPLPFFEMDPEARSLPDVDIPRLRTDSSQTPRTPE